MDDDRDNLPIAIDLNSVGVDPCTLQSHHDCNDQECEVRQCYALREQLTSGQIKVGVVTAITGLVVSGIFAFTVLFVWVMHAMSGKPMPDVPLFIYSIAGAPFVAGAIASIRIPKKARVRLEQK